MVSFTEENHKKNFEADPVLKNIGMFWDLMPKVMIDSCETDNHAQRFCWLAVNYFDQIKSKSIKEYKGISEQFQKSIAHYIIELERDDEYDKVQNLRRFMALLSKRMKWRASEKKYTITNKGAAHYMEHIMKQHEWDKDELEELGELVGEFVKFMNHEDMIEEMKVYGVDL